LNNKPLPLDAHMNFRLFTSEKKEAERLARENRDKWDSAGHVVRVALVKFLREYKQKEKEKKNG